MEGKRGEQQFFELEGNNCVQTRVFEKSSLKKIVATFFSFVSFSFVSFFFLLLFLDGGGCR